MWPWLNLAPLLQTPPAKSAASLISAVLDRLGSAQTLTKKTKVTSASNKILSNFSYLSNYWQNSLSAAERDSWEIFAHDHPLPNSFKQITLPGKSSFIRQNKPLLWTGLPIIPTAPALSPFPSVIIIDTTLFTVAPLRAALFMWPNPPPPGGYRIYGYVSGPRGPGILRDFRRGLHLIESPAGASMSRLSFIDEWVIKYGTPEVGTRFFFQTYCLREGTGALKLLGTEIGIFV